MANSYSSAKIFHHKDILDAIEREERFAPVYVRLKPTNICNHHCAYCTYGSGDTSQKTENRDTILHADMIPWEKLQEILEDMHHMGVKAITLSGGGEPLTYPHILDAVRMIKDYGMDLSLISNGQLLRGDIAKEFYDAKWVRISFDSPIAHEYMNLRNVSEAAFHAVCDNMKSFAENKKYDCVFGVNFVISKANCNHVYAAAGFLKKLGINNVKFAAMVAGEPNYHLAIKDDVIAQIHRAKQDYESDNFQIINNYENDWQDKNDIEQPFETCYTCRMVTVIAADQCVYLCHTRAYDSGALLGDLHKRGFQELWYSDETRQRLKTLNPKKSCRNFCAYQERNQLINAYFDANYDHINFI